jgi:hypothetical protein
MSDGVRRIYYTNTNPGHNKDYLIEWDLGTNVVTSTYGPIGGHKTVRKFSCRTPRDAYDYVSGKMDRRARHGYTMEYDCTADDEFEPAEAPVPVKRPALATMRYDDFDRDLREMRSAERASR